MQELYTGVYSTTFYNKRMRQVSHRGYWFW